MFICRVPGDRHSPIGDVIHVDKCIVQGVFTVQVVLLNIFMSQYHVK